MAVLTVALVHGQTPFIHKALRELSFTHSSLFFNWLQSTWNEFDPCPLRFRSTSLGAEVSASFTRSTPCCSSLWPFCVS